MKRHESRSISRNRMMVEALSPCIRFSVNAGRHPFTDLLNRLSIQKQMEGRTRKEAEKQVIHELKTKADQRSAKARKLRKQKNQKNK